MHPQDRTSDTRGAAVGDPLSELLHGGVRRCRSSAELARQSQTRVAAAQRRRQESQERLAAARRIGANFASVLASVARVSRPETGQDNVIAFRRPVPRQTPLVRRLIWELGEDDAADFAQMLMDVFAVDDDAAILAGVAELRRWVVSRHE